MDSGIKGDLTIFHAGSLTVPLNEMADSFKSQYQDVNFKMESSGSVDAARKILDLRKKADIIASADYKIIEELLIPDHAQWLIKFAANEMAIVYDKDSQYAREINQDNWREILMRDDVFFGRSDPDSDPCGYRTVITVRLAEDYYKDKNFAKRILEKNKNFMRPKETDLIALLEANALDYTFLYRSVAEQHGLKFISLPDSINLGNPEMKDYYKKATVEIAGKKPGKKITIAGEPMVYGITIPKNAQNPEAAEAFLHFVLSESKGLKILEKNGQPSLVPASSKTYEEIPGEFKKYAKP